MPNPEEEASANRKTYFDLRALEELIRDIPNHSRDDVQFQKKLRQLFDEILTLNHSISEHMQFAIRALIAQFGDAYEFYRLTGDMSLLEKFLADAKRAELLLS
jgi:hypothetical protein